MKWAEAENLLAKGTPIKRRPWSGWILKYHSEAKDSVVFENDRGNLTVLYTVNLYDINSEDWEALREDM